MKPITFWLLAAVSFVAPLCTVSAQVNEKDSLALVSFYNNTNGPSWTNHTNWLTKQPVHTWYGIRLNDFNQVGTINLASNNISGAIPAAAGDFAWLDTLNLSNNQLTGGIPLQLGKLFLLSALNLSHNQLTGGIPNELCTGLTKLSNLNLSYNQLNGSLPSALGGFFQLRVLALNNNHFSGFLPEEIPRLAQIASLGVISIQHNYFTFAGMEPYADNRYPKFTYAPQDTILPVKFMQNKLFVSFGRGAYSTIYNWYKDGVLIKTVSEDSTYTFQGEGRYSVRVTDDYMPALTLYSDTFTVSLKANIQDSLALVDLFDSTGGKSWGTFPYGAVDWPKTQPVSTWYGVSLDGNGRVFAIDLRDHGLTGKLPASIGNLEKLETLILNGNKISGTIPPSIGNLHNLMLLMVSNNQLVGHLPASLGNLTNLTELDLDQNDFDGSLPPSLGNLVNLWALDVSHNRISGKIPQQVYSFPNLIRLNITANSFDFTTLEEFAVKEPGYVYSPQHPVPILFTNNKLRAAAGGTLVNNTYKWYNGLTPITTITGDSSYTPATNGTYHAEITNAIAPDIILTSDYLIVNLQYRAPTNIDDSLALVDFYNSTDGPNWLFAGNTWLTTPVSYWQGVEVDSITGRVTGLELRFGGVKGSIPASIAKLTKLQKLVLQNAELNGIQPALFTLADLSILNLYGCKMGGSIPASFYNLTGLKELDLSYNTLEGNVSPLLTKLTKLTLLHLAGNQLTGGIPPQLSALTNLQQLDLSFNRLTGTIPVELGNLAALQTLQLSNNSLSGAIPAVIANLPALQYIGLSHNFFTFDGMALVAKRFGNDQFAYQPQDTRLPLHYSNGKLSVAAGGDVSHNKYIWYRHQPGSNYLPVAAAVGDSTYAPTDARPCMVLVTADNIPNLTLFSDTIHFTQSDVIMPAQPQTLYANSEFTDTSGWTHYYYKNDSTPGDIVNGTLLLSLKKNGQDIGSLGDGTFAVKLVATPGAGSNTGIKLTSPLITNPTGFYVMNRYWQVTATQQPAASVGVKFYYNNQDLNDVNGSYPTHNLTNDKLIFYKAVGGNPDPTSNLAGATKLISIMPGTQPTDTSWVYYKLSDTTQYGEYSVASFSGGGGGGTGNNKALPITLLNFTGNRSKTDVQLNWQTAQEINAGSYAIERSLNGADFTGIGSVQAVGNSTVRQSYSYIDANAAALNTQKLYYRLKIVNKDGSFNYSKIISLQNDGINTAYVLYPNPARTSATIQFTASATAKYIVTITNAEGKVIKRVNIAATTGVNRAVLNVGSLAHGTYIVTITGDKDKQTLTLVKE